MTLLEVKSDILTSPTWAPLTSPSLEENPLQYLQDFMYSPLPAPKPLFFLMLDIFCLSVLFNSPLFALLCPGGGPL